MAFGRNNSNGRVGGNRGSNCYCECNGVQDMGCLGTNYSSNSVCYEDCNYLCTLAQGNYGQHCFGFETCACGGDTGGGSWWGGTGRMPKDGMRRTQKGEPPAYRRGGRVRGKGRRRR